MNGIGSGSATDGATPSTTSKSRGNPNPSRNDNSTNSSVPTTQTTEGRRSWGLMNVAAGGSTIMNSVMIFR